MQKRPESKMFVEGRYRKLSRDLPQTVFFCPECKGHPRRRQGCEKCEGFGKLSRDSVQELVSWVLGKAAGTRKHKFHGAGREDVDVRMLGRGRPFIVELIAPKEHQIDLAEIERTINDRNAGRLEVEGLHWSEKERVRVLKETPGAKAYRAGVSVQGDFDLEAVQPRLGERLHLAQQTPERVAHRRADKTRERWVELRSVAPDPERPGAFIVDLVTQHGTYVKEFISGEEGKTEPSLGEWLGGVQCRCDWLDVLEILGEDGEDLPAPRKRTPPPVFGQGL
ncbi:MAG: tRNA pseudouridine(54/55) synthase Pus10 [Planctomycetota bacterium]